MTDAPRPRRRWLLWLALVFFFLCPGLILIPLGMDDPPPNDADLLAPAADIPAAENAFAELEKLASSDFVPPSQAVLAADENWYPPNPYPRKVFAAYLASNDAVFDRASALLRNKALQPPTSPENSERPYLVAFKDLGYWLAHRARVRALDGRSGEAAEDALSVLRLGLRFQAHAPSLIDWLVAAAIEGIGGSALRDVLALSAFDDAELARLDAQIKELQALRNPNSLAAALRGETRALVNSSNDDWQSLARQLETPGLPRGSEARRLAGTWLERFIYKPNRSLRLFDEQVRRQIACLEGREPYEPLEDHGSLQEYLSGNICGRELVRFHTSREVLESTRDRGEQARLELEALRTVIAIRRFQMATGRLPKTLLELCPRFLPAVPQDHDGRPLRYRPEFELIYSVGRDRTDNTPPGQEPEWWKDPSYSFKRQKKL